MSNEYTRIPAFPRESYEITSTWNPDGSLPVTIPAAYIARLESEGDAGGTDRDMDNDMDLQDIIVEALRAKVAS